MSNDYDDELLASDAYELSPPPEPLLDKVPLGHMQAVILQTLHLLGRYGSTSHLQTTIHRVTRRIVDQAQIYGALRKLEAEGFIQAVKVETEVDRYSIRPRNYFTVTRKGKCGLARTMRHYSALADYLIFNSELSGEPLSDRSKMAAFCDPKNAQAMKRAALGVVDDLLEGERREEEAEQSAKEKTGRKK